MSCAAVRHLGRDLHLVRVRGVSACQELHRRHPDKVPPYWDHVPRVVKTEMVLPQHDGELVSLQLGNIQDCPLSGLFPEVVRDHAQQAFSTGAHHYAREQLCSLAPAGCFRDLLACSSLDDRQSAFGLLPAVHTRTTGELSSLQAPETPSWYVHSEELGAPAGCRTAPVQNCWPDNRQSAARHSSSHNSLCVVSQVVCCSHKTLMETVSVHLARYQTPLHCRHDLFLRQGPCLLLEWVFSVPNDLIQGLSIGY